MESSTGGERGSTLGRARVCGDCDAVAARRLRAAATSLAFFREAQRRSEAATSERDVENGARFRQFRYT